MFNITITKMINLAESQKDEQIARQAQEIQSLNRKVDSLETELQRCLDPDNGEINPSVRYHYKTGEGALLAQIDELQKQLDDCLEPVKNFKPSNHFNAAAEEIVKALFQPVNVFEPVESKDTGKYNKIDRKYAWSNFERDLFNAANLDRFWVKKEFRYGVQLISEINTILEKEFFASAKDERPGDYGDIPWRFLFYEKTDHQIKVLECLLEVVTTFRGQPDNMMSEDEINDIRLSLTIVILMLKSGGLLRHADGDE